MSKIDQRRLERFGLKLPALLQSPSEDNRTPPRMLLTRDISSNGAYFHTAEPHSYANQVQVKLILKVPTFDNGIGHVFLTTTGEVIRRETSGLAVKFDDGHKLAYLS
ncbi:MAG: PilZ domain-containing protein [Geobacteraceae bacterium]|nr:MAG: PilZ domain-containing protein [Geobacteraceae bacterium]